MRRNSLIRSGFGDRRDRIGIGYRHLDPRRRIVERGVHREGYHAIRTVEFSSCVPCEAIGWNRRAPQFHLADVHIDVGHGNVVRCSHVYGDDALYHAPVPRRLDGHIRRLDIARNWFPQFQEIVIDCSCVFDIPSPAPSAVRVRRRVEVVGRHPVGHEGHVLRIARVQLPLPFRGEGVGRGTARSTHLAEVVLTGVLRGRLSTAVRVHGYQGRSGDIFRISEEDAILARLMMTVRGGAYQDPEPEMVA